MGRSGPVVLVVPTAPRATGNGLAMRAGMLLDALAEETAVHVVVVPVSGAGTACSWATSRAACVVTVDPVGTDTAPHHLVQQLADPELRAALQRTDPVPGRVALAPPSLAPNVAALLPDDLGDPAAVVAFRAYLAPLGVQLARLLGARRVVVDLDDDDVALLRSLGDADEAEAYERLLRGWLPLADAVLAASVPDASGVARRAGIDRVTVVPNAVTIPPRTGPPPGADRVLFLGNLTYEPNRAAAELLARHILPRVRRRRPQATVELVGRSDGSLDGLRGLEGVRLVGEVPDVAPHYANTDVVVVPLRHGSGTRIKVLEAFAHRRPLVATPIAVAGLDVEPGEHAVIAEEPAELARAVDELLDDPRRASEMVDRAARLVAARYSRTVVAAMVRAAVLGPGSHRLPEGPAAA